MGLIAYAHDEWWAWLPMCMMINDSENWGILLYETQTVVIVVAFVTEKSETLLAAWHSMSYPLLYNWLDIFWYNLRFFIFASICSKLNIRIRLSEWMKMKWKQNFDQRFCKIFAAVEIQQQENKDVIKIFPNLICTSDIDPWDSILQDS